jgi:hypothetical protein
VGEAESESEEEQEIVSKTVKITANSFFIL